MRKKHLRSGNLTLPRVCGLVRQGILPGVRIGAREIRFDRTRLLQWIERGGTRDTNGSEDQLQEAKDGLGTYHAKRLGGLTPGKGGSLRCGCRQGSPPGFDELRERKRSRFVLDRIPLLRLGRSTGLLCAA